MAGKVLKPVGSISPDELFCHFARALELWHSGISSEEMRIYMDYCRGVSKEDMMLRFSKTEDAIRHIIWHVTDIFTQKERNYTTLLRENTNLKNMLSSYTINRKSIDNLSEACVGYLSSIYINQASPDGYTLSPRTRNALSSCDIINIYSLTRLTETQVLALNGIGQTAILEIRRYLNGFGLRLYNGAVDDYVSMINSVGPSAVKL